MTTKAGLDGVIAADTVLSEVDGEAGRLIVRGYSLDEIVGRWSFEEALALLRREKPGRSLDTNVEFYTALLLEALEIPRTAFTCVFAAGRVGGWIAHAREQITNGRLLRPISRYVGPVPAASMRSFHQPPPNATSNPAVS